MTNEELIETIDELEARIGMLKDTVQGLEDKLHALAAPAPTLPEEPGWYLTQQHLLLLKDSCGDWSVRNINGCPIQGFWREGSFDFYTKDPKVVYEALGPDAFPLVPISEVILPSEHIKEDEED